MEREALKIGKYTISKPIIQGGMGVGVSWDQLAGHVSKEGALGVISSVGTGYYEDKKFSHKNVSDKPFTEENFYCEDSLKEIFKNTRKICGDAPIKFVVTHL